MSRKESGFRPEEIDPEVIRLAMRRAHRMRAQMALTLFDAAAAGVRRLLRSAAGWLARSRASAARRGRPSVGPTT